MAPGKKHEGSHASQDSASPRSGRALSSIVSDDQSSVPFKDAQSGSRLADNSASLQRRFHEDRNAALEWVTEAGDPALVPMLVDVLQDEAITHFHMAEALEQITDEPDRTSAIEIKRSEEAQVAPFPPRAVTSAAEDDKIRELVEEGELRKALQTNPARASELIAEDAKIALRHSHANTLTRLLREQAGVQAFMALALARIAEEPQQKSRAIEILFAEAAQLSSDRETLCFILRSLQSFEALTVIPGLIAYLQKADDGPPRDAALETLQHLILHGLAADASDAARRARDLTLRFFVALLGGAAMDEQEQATVAGIVLRCAGPLEGGLDAVIKRMARLSNVAVTQMGLRICGPALMKPTESNVCERGEAADWMLRRRSATGEDTWPLYAAILSQSDQEEHRRVAAARRLGTHGPTAAQTVLYEQSGVAESPKLKREAALALKKNIKRAKASRMTPSPSLTPEKGTGKTDGMDVGMDTNKGRDAQNRADRGSLRTNGPAAQETTSLPPRSGLLDPSIQAQIAVVFKALGSIAKEHPESIPTMRTSWDDLLANLGEVSQAAHDAPVVEGSQTQTGGENLSVEQAATELDISPRTVRYHCVQEHLPGAKRIGELSWLIPRESLVLFREKYPDDRQRRGRKASRA